MIFADTRNNEFLISFLKSVLQLPGEDYAAIELLDPNLSREFAEDKLGIVDVKLHTKSGKTIHIEIQLSVPPEMRNRIVFYDAKLITEQIGKGDNYDIIKKVISIVILDENMIHDSHQYHHKFTFYDPSAEVELTDIIEIHTLELKKLPQDSDGSKLYDWARFIAADRKEDLDMIGERNPEVGRAVVKLMELSSDEKTRIFSESQEKARRDEASRTNWAVKQAVEEAEKRTEAKVRKQQKAEIARSLIGMLPVDAIVSATGLTRDEVEALKIANYRSTIESKHKSIRNQTIR
jgi:predicted transposase/invertase (TIGR01784 family)